MNDKDMSGDIKGEALEFARQQLRGVSDRAKVLMEQTDNNPRISAQSALRLVLEEIDMRLQILG